MTAPWAAIFALAAEAARYPLPLTPPPAVPQGVAVADVQYALSEQPRLVQHATARVRIGRLGYAGGFVKNQLRGLALQTYRLDADASEENGQHEYGAAFRTSRFRLASRVLLPPESEPRDLAVEAGVRLDPDTEASASYLEEGRPRPFPSNPYREVALQLERQGDRGLELALRATRSTVPTVAGFDFHRHRLAATGARALRTGEVEAELGFERTGGRLASSEVFLGAALRAPMWSRVLVELRTRDRWEPGVSVFEHEHGAALSLHARRVVLARAGEAAARTAALARLANERGANARRGHDDLARRALREQAGLSPYREELAEAVDALYAAQVAERLVPLVGVEAAAGRDAVRGIRSRSYRAFVGAPWPLGLPWQHDDEAVPFVRVSYARTEARHDVAPTTVDWDASVAVELNREHSLVATWSRPGRTPLDLVRVTSTAKSFRVAYVYARGR
ncbi:MAG: hypothetical protein ABW221_06610 [Vicinamibacteria bacterium]